MIKFLKGLLGGKPGGGKQLEAVVYNGYAIVPAPQNTGSGWSTEGIIRKEIDGVTREHKFIRADSSTSEDAAVSLIISKARMLIDQQGDGIFPAPE